MQDMTDNPRAFYEYLIQNKINENYQIIWMVSDKKKCEKLKCKNVKFVTAENKYGWSRPSSFIFLLRESFVISYPRFYNLPDKNYDTPEPV